MTASLQTFYSDKISEYNTRIQVVQKRLTGIALLRLAAFLSFALSIYYLLKEFSYPLLVLTGILAAGFILLVRVFFQLKDHRALLEKLLFVNSNESALLQNELNGFEDGQAFLTQESYLDDLDIFGKRSLFHLLNRTTTSHGKERLAGLLKQPLLDGEEITRYQQAVRSLAPQSDLRQSLIAHGLLNQEKEGNLHSLADWLQSPTRLIQRKWVLIISWLIIAFNTASLIYLAATGNYRPLLAGVLAGWILTGSFGKYLMQQYNLLGKKQAVLSQYAEILTVFNTVDCSGAEELQRLRTQTGKAQASIRRLARLSSYFDQQLNMFVSFVLNNLFLYNLQCLIALERWKAANKEAFPEWIAAVGNIECLNTMATFAFNHPDYCYPTPISSPVPIPSDPTPAQQHSIPPGLDPASPNPPTTPSLYLKAIAMAHPLIPGSESITNDFEIGKDERLILVTGSNMSGKTTFLRTTGVNLLLAQCGAPVCATSFTFTPMHILTSLRVSDSLQEHTSYFMAELKKLQQIIHELQTGKPALVLIDEILRGTNSEDKTHGSERFILKLLQYRCLSLFATHDLSLGQLEHEKPGMIRNYCFESIIEAGELHFNYLLQRGIARNRNASFLMEKMDII